MKILLDENIDVNFKEELAGHEVQTVKDNRWAGTENGDLLKLILENEFNAFITLDSNLIYQQNVSNLNFHILILKAKDSRLAHLKLFIPKIRLVLDRLSAERKFEVIEIFL